MVACRFIGSAPYLWTLDLGFKTLDFDLVLTINNFLHPFRSIIAQYIIVKYCQLLLGVTNVYPG